MLHVVSLKETPRRRELHSMAKPGVLLSCNRAERVRIERRALSTASHCLRFVGFFFFPLNYQLFRINVPYCFVVSKAFSKKQNLIFIIVIFVLVMLSGRYCKPSLVWTFLTFSLVSLGNVEAAECCTTTADMQACIPIWILYICSRKLKHFGFTFMSSSSCIHSRNTCWVSLFTKFIACTCYFSKENVFLSFCQQVNSVFMT